MIVKSYSRLVEILRSLKVFDKKVINSLGFGVKLADMRLMKNSIDPLSAQHNNKKISKKRINADLVRLLGVKQVHALLDFFEEEAVKYISDTGTDG